LALKLAAKLWQPKQQATSNNTDDINSNSNININSKPQQLATVESSTTTILSALKRCNYFMPDNNLILSMPQNVQVPI